MRPRASAATRSEVAQQVGEHGSSGRPIGAQQATHVGQRIEEEVRLDLGLQQLQSAGHELTLQAQSIDLDLVQRIGCAQTALPILAEYSERHGNHEQPKQPRPRLGPWERPAIAVDGQPSGKAEPAQ